MSFVTFCLVDIEVVQGRALLEANNTFQRHRVCTAALEAAEAHKDSALASARVEVARMERQCETLQDEVKNEQHKLAVMCAAQKAKKIRRQHPSIYLVYKVKVHVC